MSVVYSAATKTARMNAVVSQIGTSGKLKLRTAADVLLATFTLAATAGTVSGDTLTFSDANGGTAGILNTTGVAAGVAAKAEITTSADVVVINGLTVGTSAADLIVDNTNIANGQGVTITSASIQHAA
jgi:hypothetical protein